MTLFLPLAIALGFCLVPVWLVRKPRRAHARDYFIASQPTPPDVIRNACIVHFLRIATFAPLFVWGAGGDFWAAVLAAACLGAGVYLVSALRQPILSFLDGALTEDTSATVHEFVANRYGSDRFVRVLAASLTVAALTGLITVEGFAISTLAQPLLIGAAGSALPVAAAMLVLALIYTTVSGNSGVMHSVQVLLGFLYFGLFGSIALVLYFIVSDASPTPPQAKVAIIIVAGAGALIMFYRRSKYVETARIETADEAVVRTARASRLLSRFEKILNPFISGIVVFVIVLAAMEIFSVGFSAMARDSFAGLRMGTNSSLVMLASLALLALVYPLVDVRTWQLLTAAAKETQSDAALRSGALERILHSVAVEVPLVWVVMAMFGALAVLVIETASGRDALQMFVAGLAAEQGGPADFVVSFLLVAVLAMALSAMSGMFSAMLWVLRYDIVPALWPDIIAQSPAGQTESIATRRTVLMGAALCATGILLVRATSGFLGVAPSSTGFLALTIACCCAQVAVVPLLLPTLLAPARSMNAASGGVSAPWAVAILGAGAGSGIAAALVYAATGNETWLWGAIPVCIGSGIVLLLIARVWRRRR
ncbi:MAG: hypothetical protein ABWZ64_04500 [Xanthobacteraceae bacterium]